MIRQKLSIALATALVCLATTAQADIVNGGFESGLTGWTTTGTASATATNVSSGALAALITSAANTDLNAFTGATIPGEGGGGLKQTFSTAAPGTLTFVWDFQTDEGTPSFFNDAAYVVIDGTAFLLADTTSLFVGGGDGFDGKTGYQSFSFGLGAGSHTLAFAVTDVGDDLLDSGLFVDAVAVTNQVPEPGTLALLAVGLIGMAALRTRQSV